jgi:hypothetical protein
MKHNMFFLFITVTLLFLTACASGPETLKPEVTTEPDTASAIEGVWTGDWGPNAADRNQVTVEIKWDGETLKGTVNPGPDAVELQNASFDPGTGAIHFEADAMSRAGTPIHYLIDGKLTDNTIAGSWNHDDRSGDFTITKK